ncbi:MAG: PHP domain-containing protein, partial [Anaerolineales bacterium]|nr:PHP domain-containing protein [Anaerolineales bacterium]
MDELPPYFTHLHVHSHYSLLGGTASVADLVARAAAEGWRALALTDSAALYGAVALHKACRAANIQPIIGLTLPIATPAEDLAEQTTPGQLVLLAQNPAGYRSLCRLASQLDGGQPAELSQLRDFSEGVICLDGGRRGWLNRFVRMGNTAAAVRYASRLAAIFQENGYVGVELTAVSPTQRHHT